ncbi:Peroxiredoxin [Coemansia linderi]|uniref:Peroxiredoxin n=1 Tax=Coemansia linderi TaxID=2663919 RepID=A0ACC1K0L2_9FUNG|nr:Peroxiredoxin [Coemansia linderi]
MSPFKRVSDCEAVSATLTKKLKITATISTSDEESDPVAQPASNRCVVGRPAPEFAVPAVLADGSITSITLSQFKGQYLVLLFYPADFTFVCPTEITSFSDHIASFAELNCAVAVCSTDSEYAHYNWRQQARKDGGVGPVAVPMLADRTMEMSRSYGVLNEDEGRAFRGLFVIDPKQVVRIAVVNDMPVGRSVEETLRLVSALKFTEENGQVCPANWKAGDMAIDPDIARSKAFFKSSD